ncbi:unnamed protein product [Pedinophyceae sp. YPF-701]|nr:unnamed protein product [Pedinophyceae sp. YPF-701]
MGGPRFSGVTPAAGASSGGPKEVVQRALEALRALQDPRTMLDGLHELRGSLTGRDAGQTAQELLLRPGTDGFPELWAVWDVRRAGALTHDIQIAALGVAIALLRCHASLQPHRKALREATDGIATQVLERRLKQVYYHLTSGSRSRAAGALALLSAIAARSRGLSLALLSSFDWTLSSLSKLARPPKRQAQRGGQDAVDDDQGGAPSGRDKRAPPTGADGRPTYYVGADVLKRPTRPALVLLSLTLLQQGDRVLAQQVLATRPLARCLLSHCASDPDGVVNDVFDAVDRHVMDPRAAVPPSVQSCVFHESALRQLAEILAAPSGAAPPGVQERAYSILFRVLTDPAHGVRAPTPPSPSPDSPPDDLLLAWQRPSFLIAHELAAKKDDRDLSEQQQQGAAILSDDHIVRLLLTLCPSAAPLHRRVVEEVCAADPALARAYLMKCALPLDPKPERRFYVAAAVFARLATTAAEAGVSECDLLGTPRERAERRERRERVREFKVGVGFEDEDLSTDLDGDCFRARRSSEAGERAAERTALPPCANKTLLSRGLQHPDPRVRAATAVAVTAMVHAALKTATEIDVGEQRPPPADREPESLAEHDVSVMKAEFCHTVLRHLPDEQVVASLIAKTQPAWVSGWPVGTAARESDGKHASDAEMDQPSPRGAGLTEEPSIEDLRVVSEDDEEFDLQPGEPGSKPTETAARTELLPLARAAFQLADAYVWLFEGAQLSFQSNVPGIRCLPPASAFDGASTDGPHPGILRALVALSGPQLGAHAAPGTAIDIARVVRASTAAREVADAVVGCDPCRVDTTLRDTEMRACFQRRGAGVSASIIGSLVGVLKREEEACAACEGADDGPRVAAAALLSDALLCSGVLGAPGVLEAPILADSLGVVFRSDGGAGWLAAARCLVEAVGVCQRKAVQKFEGVAATIAASRRVFEAVGEQDTTNDYSWVSPLTMELITAASKVIPSRKTSAEARAAVADFLGTAIALLVDAHPHPAAASAAVLATVHGAGADPAAFCREGSGLIAGALLKCWDVIGQEARGRIPSRTNKEPSSGPALEDVDATLSLTWPWTDEAIPLWQAASDTARMDHLSVYVVRHGNHAALLPPAICKLAAQAARDARVCADLCRLMASVSRDKDCCLRGVHLCVLHPRLVARIIQEAGPSSTSAANIVGELLNCVAFAAEERRLFGTSERPPSWTVADATQRVVRVLVANAPRIFRLAARQADAAVAIEAAASVVLAAAQLDQGTTAALQMLEACCDALDAAPDPSRRSTIIQTVASSLARVFRGPGAHTFITAGTPRLAAIMRIVAQEQGVSASPKLQQLLEALLEPLQAAASQRQAGFEGLLAAVMTSCFVESERGVTVEGALVAAAIVAIEPRLRKQFADLLQRASAEGQASRRESLALLLPAVAVSLTSKSTDASVRSTIADVVRAPLLAYAGAKPPGPGHSCRELSRDALAMLHGWAAPCLAAVLSQRREGGTQAARKLLAKALPPAGLSDCPVLQMPQARASACERLWEACPAVRYAHETALQACASEAFGSGEGIVAGDGGGCASNTPVAEERVLVARLAFRWMVREGMEAVEAACCFWDVAARCLRATIETSASSAPPDQVAAAANAVALAVTDLLACTCHEHRVFDDAALSETASRAADELASALRLSLSSDVPLGAALAPLAEALECCIGTGAPTPGATIVRAHVGDVARQTLVSIAHLGPTKAVAAALSGRDAPLTGQVSVPREIQHMPLPASALLAPSVVRSAFAETNAPPPAPAERIRAAARCPGEAWAATVAACVRLCCESEQGASPRQVTHEVKGACQTVLPALLASYGGGCSGRDAAIASALFAADLVLTGVAWNELGSVGMDIEESTSEESSSDDAGNEDDEDSSEADSASSGGDRRQARGRGRGPRVQATAGDLWRAGRGAQDAVRAVQAAMSRSVLATAGFAFGEAAAQCFAAGGLIAASGGGDQLARARVMLRTAALDPYRLLLTTACLHDADGRPGDGAPTAGWGRHSYSVMWVLCMAYCGVREGWLGVRDVTTAGILPLAICCLAAPSERSRVLAHALISITAEAMSSGPKFRERPSLERVLAYVARGVAAHGPARRVSSLPAHFAAHCAAAAAVRGSQDHKFLDKWVRRKRELAPASAKHLDHLLASTRPHPVCRRDLYDALRAASVGVQGGALDASALRRSGALGFVLAYLASCFRDSAVYAAGVDTIVASMATPGCAVAGIADLFAFAWAAERMRELQERWPRSVVPLKICTRIAELAQKAFAWPGCAALPGRQQVPLTVATTSELSVGLFHVCTVTTSACDAACAPAAERRSRGLEHAACELATAAIDLVVRCLASPLPFFGMPLLHRIDLGALAGGAVSLAQRVRGGGGARLAWAVLGLVAVEPRGSLWAASVARRALPVALASVGRRGGVPWERREATLGALVAWVAAKRESFVQDSAVAPLARELLAATGEAVDGAACDVQAPS